MSTPPPRPFHRWQSNENVDHPITLDRCLACQVRRFSDDPAIAAAASGPCPSAVDPRATL